MISNNEALTIGRKISDNEEWPVGRKIVEIRVLRKSIIEQECWREDWYPGLEIVLDDGSVLYPSADSEGNGPGALFGIDNYERSITIYPQSLEAK